MALKLSKTLSFFKITKIISSRINRGIHFFSHIQSIKKFKDLVVTSVGECVLNKRLPHPALQTFESHLGTVCQEAQSF